MSIWQSQRWPTTWINPRPVAPVSPLTAVLADPERVTDLTTAVKLELYRQLGPLVARLYADVLADMLAGTQGHLEDSDKLLDMDEAAKYLRTTKDSLYRKRRRTKLGFKDPLDGKIKFALTELKAHIARQGRKP